MSGKGLLVDGRIVVVSGLEIIAPHSHGGPAWAQLSPRDYGARKTRWIRQVISHSTKGDEPQHVKPGAGMGGRDQVVADFWRGDDTHSGAQLVIDNDGSIVCLVDLQRCAAYHATVSNEWSVGIEIYQESDRGIYEAALIAFTLLCRALCDGTGATFADTGEAWGGFGIPFQIPGPPYKGHPLARMLHGGPDVAGILGHRDNTERRGRGDPGDEAFRRLAEAGAEMIDYDGQQDRELGRLRQKELNRRTLAAHSSTVGTARDLLTPDGIVGPSSWAAMKRHGFAQWRDVPTLPPIG